jgi:asparagine synthase (glutamine-hydrolysing)
VSGIAAIIHFDESDVGPGAIERMTTEMHYRGPDGVTHWREGGAALGFCALHTTAESMTSEQPLLSDDGNLVVIFDGYLHYIEEARKDLKAKGARFRSNSDVEIILRAYEAWGEDCPKYLDGEYAFLIWDRRRQAAFCARDHAGQRPLHYHWDGNGLTIASDPGAILVAPGVVQETNLPFLVQVLTNEWITRGQTVWMGVMRLNAAECGRFSREGASFSTYWSPPLEVSIRYQRDEDYYEHYRTLLEDCVAQSSRCQFPIGSDVSGGLDSSAVFAVAEHLRREGRLQALGVKGYTYKFETGSAPDELDYARAVGAHMGVKVREIAPFFPDIVWFTERGRQDRDMSPYPNTAMAVSIGEALVKDGCRVILNGEGGDEWLGGRPFYYSEQLAERDWAAIRRSWREDVSEIGLKWAAYRFARFGLAAFIPEVMGRAVRNTIRPRGPNDFDGAFWLEPEYATILEGERRRVARRDAWDTIANRPRRSMFITLRNPFNELARDQFTRQCARQGYEPRTPMYARRYIEFAFSTPERVRLHGKRRKHVHVQALQDLLPQKVLTRQTKADFSLAFEHYLNEMKAVFAKTLPAASGGVLNRNGLARLYECYRAWPLDARPIWELWGAFACAVPFEVIREKLRKSNQEIV